MRIILERSVHKEPYNREEEVGTTETVRGEAGGSTAVVPMAQVHFTLSL